MSNPSECIICGRSTEEGEHFVEIDDGYVCHDCLIDLKEIKKDHYGGFGEETR
jgi:hypothetical protein